MVETNHIDALYDSLRRTCTLDIVEPKSEEFNLLEKYVNKSASHIDNRVKKIDAVFKITRKKEELAFNPKKHSGKKLLFHGSRADNFYRILAEGLKISPKEVPHTAFNFGRGVYFTDFFYKASQYCRPYLSDNNCLIIVCEVALGTPQSLLSTNTEAHNLPNGCHSTECLGVNQSIPA